MELFYNLRFLGCFTGIIVTIQIYKTMKLGVETMKKTLLSKRGKILLIGMLIFGSLLIGSATLAGTLSVKNQDGLNTADAIDEQEAIAIASAIPEVATFLENHPNTTIDAYFDSFWAVEFVAMSFDLDESFYYGFNYAYVEIDATTGEVLYYEIFEQVEPNYTESEILAIAGAIPEIAAWLDEQPDVETFVWFDGYEYWFVDYYASESWAWVVISDKDGSVDYYDIYYPYAGAIHTKDEIVAIVEALPEVQAWIAENPDYEMTVTYMSSTYWDESIELENFTEIFDDSFDAFFGVNESHWYVDFWAWDNDSYWCKWLGVTIDDTTGEVLAIEQTLEPTLTAEEVLAIAEAIPEIQTFLASLTSYETSVWFDPFTGNWYVNFWDNNNWMNSAFVEINDATGEVTYFEILTDS